MTEHPLQGNSAAKRTSDKDESPLVLVVDDDPVFSAELEKLLLRYGFTVRLGGDLQEGLALAEDQEPRVIILDQNLGRYDAIEHIADFREISCAPILVLTSNDDVSDRVLALETGADDYMTKTMPGREMIARLRVQMRRFAKSQPRLAAEAEAGARERQEATGSTPANFGAGWTFSREARAIIRPGLHPSQITLTAAEFDLISMLVAATPLTVHRDIISEAVFRRPWQFGDRAIDNMVARIRGKLERGGAEADAIRSVRGVGYVFVPAQDLGTFEDGMTSNGASGARRSP